MFTQFKFSPDQIAAQAAATLQALASIVSELAGAGSYAARIIANRLRNHPEAYLEFGPYWWAVKAALRSAGEEFGAADDEILRIAYAGELPLLETVVAGEMFKDYYRATYLVGARQFWLDDGAEESYVLFDANMEARRLGRGAVALAVAANLEATQEPSETENPPDPAA